MQKWCHSFGPGLLAKEFEQQPLDVCYC